MEMTSVERISNILKRKPVDRIGLLEAFWGDTKKAWADAGHITMDTDMNEHFNFDINGGGDIKMVADLDFVPEVIEETEETIVVKDGNGSTMRRHKLHDTTPEHIDFAVKDRKGWEELIKPKLAASRERIDFEGYRKAKRKAAENNRFFVWSGVNVFELMHPVCGHEYMLMGMALDPDWIKDMVMTYAKLSVQMQEMLFSEEGEPDGVWYYEDLGFKQRPFMSPAMFDEIIYPGHKHTMDFAKSKKLPVIMHSCGYVEPLIPSMIRAGVDCLQVIEVKAGMDLLKIYKDFGDNLSFIGGIDVRTLYTNNRDIIDKELESKIPEVMKKFGYCLHSDHSIPNTVNYETYRYFIDKGIELGTYK